MTFQVPTGLRSTVGCEGRRFCKHESGAMCLIQPDYLVNDHGKTHPYASCQFGVAYWCKGV